MKYLSIILLALANILYAQNNYVRTRTMLTASGSTYMETISYADGFGRMVQVNNKKQSGDGAKDIVTLTQYDGCGRVDKEWAPLSIASNGGFTNTQSLLDSSNDTHPFSLNSYDPLNRLVKKTGVGRDWHSADKGSTSQYLLNSATVPEFQCIKYSVSSDGTITKGGYYADYELSVVKQQDEDGITLYQFKDKQDRLVLERRKNASVYHDSYFIYDRVGNLRYILPPALSASATLSADLIGKYAFYYVYDDDGRCIRKQLPGNVVYYYVYDKAGRLRMSQDNNLLEKGQWIYYKYDELGRMILTGLLKSWDSYEVVKANILNNGIISERFSISGQDLYTCNSYPTNLNNMITLIVDYYDNYNYQQALPSLFDNCKGYISGVSDPEHSEARTMKTGSKVALLDNPTEYLWTTYRYDKNGLPIQTIEMNTLGGLDKEFVKYSFTGQVLKKRLEHTSISTNPSMTEVYTYTYDHADRLTSIYYGEATPFPIFKLSYDDLGRLKTKELWESSVKMVDRINYRYNIRGWLSDINSSSFNQHLYYADAPTGINKIYNGNISAQTISYPKTSSLVSGYSFEYDGLNRLTKAIYGEGDQLTTNCNRFDETFTYDLNSNIKSQRNRGAKNGGYYIIQGLEGRYDGNRLVLATNEALSSESFNNQFMPNDPLGGSVRYYYDANGNLTQDSNKGISLITYNYLNLPETVQMKNGNSIHYTYDALGRKRGKSIVTLKSVVDVPMGQLHSALADEIKSNRKIYYCSNLEYAGLTKIGLYLQHIPDGYVANGECYFQITDHLGNVRAEVGAVHNEANYYPSGIQHNFSYLDKDYAFANKEFQSSHRLNLYDFGERYYEMHLSHWTTMDPLCEKYYWLSPYSYCGGNPVNRIDPTGADWVLISDSDGERYEWRDAVTSADDIYEDGVQYIGRHATDMLTHAGLDIAARAVVKTESSTHTTSDGIEHEVDLYEIDGNYLGDKAFKFLADNTKVEWTLFNIGKTEMSADGKSYLTTSKEVNADYGNFKVAPYLNEDSPIYPKMNVLSHTHNHPGGTKEPSRDDKLNMGNLSLYSPYARFFIYTKKGGFNQYPYTK